MLVNKFNNFKKIYLAKKLFLELVEIFFYLIIINIFMLFIFRFLDKSVKLNYTLLIFRSVFNILFIFYVLYKKYFYYIVLINNANKSFVAGDTQLSHINLENVPDDVMGDFVRNRERVLCFTEEQKKSLENLVEDFSNQKERLEAILCSIADGVIVVDNQLKIGLVNDTAKFYLIKKEEQIINSKIPITTQVSLLDKNKQTIALDKILNTCLQKTKPKKLTNVHLQTSLGEILTVNVNFIPLLNKNFEGTGLVIVFQDITEIVKVNEIKDDFIKTLSHELRTPLTPIKGFAELLVSREYDREKFKKYANTILIQANKLQDLILQLLSLKELEENKTPNEFKLITVSDFISKNIANLQKVYPNYKLKVNCETNNLKIKGDENLLNRVLEIFISNAVKFSSSEFTINVVAQKFNYAEKESAIIKVIDEGIGVPEKEKKLIFDKFYRVDKKDARIYYGSGLGLSIAKHIVELHKGEIKVEDNIMNNEKKGSIFSFIIPSEN